MEEGRQMADRLVAPLEGRGEKPAEGEDEPPEEGGHHAVVEEGKDEDARRVNPLPGDGRADELVFRARDERASEHQCQKVAERVDVEGECEVDDGAPGVVEARRVEKEGEQR